MDGNSSTGDGCVNVTMELTGTYESIVTKLDSPQTENDNLSVVTADFSTLLKTVLKIGGGTRSVIAEELPASMEESYDAQAVVETLQVLERYDLVVLEGNTWKPGPELRE